MKSGQRKANLGIAKMKKSENYATMNRMTKRLQSFPFEDEQERHKVKKDFVTWVDHPHKISVQSFDDLHEFLKNKCGVEDDVLDKAAFNPHAKCPCCLTYALVASKRELAMQRLLENQYEIKWNTENHDPEPLNFYKLCGNSEMFLTYDIRRANVITRLWQKQEELRKISDLDYKQLCPPVYTRDGDGWRTCTYDNNGKPNEKRNMDIQWIENQRIRDHIEENSTVTNFDGKSQVYWAVFIEDDARAYNGENIPPSTTQVYIGKAERGIKKRWLGSAPMSHCKRMDMIRNILSPMLAYNPTSVQSCQLVDLRFLLHKVCNPDGKNSGLFILDENTNLNEAEKKGMSDFKKILNLPRGNKKNMNFCLNAILSDAKDTD